MMIGHQESRSNDPAGSIHDFAVCYAVEHARNRETGNAPRYSMRLLNESEIHASIPLSTKDKSLECRPRGRFLRLGLCFPSVVLLKLRLDLLKFIGDFAALGNIIERVIDDDNDRPYPAVSRQTTQAMKTADDVVQVELGDALRPLQRNIWQTLQEIAPAADTSPLPEAAVRFSPAFAGSL